MDRCGVQRPVGQGRQLRCSVVVMLCGGVAALLCGCGCVAVQLWECMTGGNAEGEQEEMAGKEGGHKRRGRCLPRRRRCPRLRTGRFQCEAKQGVHAPCLRPGEEETASRRLGLREQQRG